MRQCYERSFELEPGLSNRSLLERDEDAMTGNEGAEGGSEYQLVCISQVTGSAARALSNSPVIGTSSKCLANLIDWV